MVFSSLGPSHRHEKDLCICMYKIYNIMTSKHTGEQSYVLHALKFAHKHLQVTNSSMETN